MGKVRGVLLLIIFTPPFQNGGLDRTSTFKGGLLGKKRITFFKGGRGVTFHVKNKLKSEIFNDKTSLQAKNFFSVITKASN